MKTMQPSDRNRGFTLIELLVVISIITLLIALLMPALKAARNVARQMLCMSQERMYGLSAFLYDNDYKELPPQGGNSNSPNTWQTSAVNSLKQNYGFADYFRQCPSASKWDRLNSAKNQTMYIIMGGRGAYAIPSDAINGWRFSHWPNWKDGWFPQLSNAKPDPRSSMPLFYSDFMNNPPTANSTVPPFANHVDGNGQATGGNFLYLDGHAEWQRLQVGVSWRAETSPYSKVWTTPKNFVPPFTPIYYTGP